jgi:hypothetical protein
MACLFCDSQNIKDASYPRPTRFNNKIFYYKECKDCELVYIDPLPSADDYDKMYEKSYHEKFYFSDVPPDFSMLYQILEKFVTNRYLMDYGCGDGSFVNYFTNKGYKCIGVEYDKDLVEILKIKRPGIEFYTVEEFLILKPNVKFGVIYLGDVLEHLSDPKSFVQKLVDRLEVKGLLMGQGPLENNKNIALTVRKSISKILSINKVRTAIHHPYHITFSNTKNQLYFFEGLGLKTAYYKISETSWPFPEKFSFNPVRGLYYVVGKFSIFFSKLFSKRMGNRFIYIGQKIN